MRSGVPWDSMRRRRVDRVAPQVVQEALAADDAGDDRPGVDADPEHEVEVADGTVGARGGDHVEREQGQDAGVVGPRVGDARRDHVGVADGLDLLEAVALGERVELAEQSIEQPDDLGRRQPVRSRREVDDVREQHRRRRELVGDRLRRVLQPLGDRAREDVQQQVLGPLLRDPQSDAARPGAASRTAPGA